MKTSHAVSLATVAVLIAVAIEESRIATIRSSLSTGVPSSTGDVKNPGITGAGRSGAETEEAVTQARTRTRKRPESPASSAKNPGDSGESLAKTVRKMWDNPTGKSMMNQGVKMAVAMMYEEFIDGLELSKEESDYFKQLLGRELAAQQEVGMKMLGASAEERRKLAEELARSSNETDEEIRKFLNSDEDFRSYTDYKNRLPERQQLDGIRAAMTAKGVSLDKETEIKLVDAMYRARTNANASEVSGPQAMESLAEGGMVESFEKSWERQQETLRKETSGILSEAQMAAFQEQQNQYKQMQLMGLKMVEKMTPGKQDSEN